MDIKDIKTYFNVKKELSEKCQDYFLEHKPFEGAYYSGWDFINENSIEITYSRILLQGSPRVSTVGGIATTFYYFFSVFFSTFAFELIFIIKRVSPLRE